MKQLNTLIEDHYYQPELYKDILKRLKVQGVDLNNVSRNDIAGVDEFHVRGAEVSKELVKKIDLNGSKILDIGCGIGGPSRMLAEELNGEFNSRVTGVDISHEFIKTARKLSELVGLKDKTEFVQADALNLPFKNESFNIVWTQHVQMNINDKAKFYSEIKRVLTDKGTLIYYDIFMKNNEDVNYPVPWANDASLSFWGTIASMDNLLKDLKFIKVQTKDQTNNSIKFLKGISEKFKENGSSKMGLNVLMGVSTKEKLGNILKGLEENKIVLQSGIYKKYKLSEVKKTSFTISSKF